MKRGSREIHGTVSREIHMKQISREIHVNISREIHVKLVSREIHTRRFCLCSDSSTAKRSAIDVSITDTRR